MPQKVKHALTCTIVCRWWLSQWNLINCTIQESDHFFHQIRKIPIKNEEEDEEGHPPGENEETKSEEQSESVWESWKEVLHEMW